MATLSSHGETTSSGSSLSTEAEVQRLLRQRAYTEARRLIDTRLADSPTDPKWLFRKGLALAGENRPNDALKLFRKLTDEHPEMPAPYNNIAVLLAGLGDYEAALRSLDVAIKVNPQYATAYQNQGDIHIRMASAAYAKAAALSGESRLLANKIAMLDELSRGAMGGTVQEGPSTNADANKDSSKKAAPRNADAMASAQSPTPASPTASDAEQGVRTALQAWAKAWSDRQTAAYISAYEDDFRGSATSHEQWAAIRRERIEGRKHIAVSLEQVKIEINADIATVQFKQRYASDALNEVTSKTLELARGPDGRWKIRKEVPRR